MSKRPSPRQENDDFQTGLRAIHTELQEKLDEALREFSGRSEKTLALLRERLERRS